MEESQAGQEVLPWMREEGQAGLVVLLLKEEDLAGLVVLGDQAVLEGLLRKEEECQVGLAVLPLRVEGSQADQEALSLRKMENQAGLEDFGDQADLEALPLKEEEGQAVLVVLGDQAGLGVLP